MVLSAYNSVRARLLNSQALLEETNLVLYNLNEATLIRWYKNSIRRDEIKTLTQGLSLPLEQPCATDPLPPAQERPSSPGAAGEHEHLIEEPEDTTGQAKVKGSVTPAASLASDATTVSRTTAWPTEESCCRCYCFYLRAHVTCCCNVLGWECGASCHCRACSPTLPPQDLIFSLCPALVCIPLYCSTVTF